MARAARIWPAVVTLVTAVALEIMPLPEMLQPLRPPLPAMALLYWVMMWPERFGLLTAFILGIVLDILHGQLLGQNALALCVMAYITVRFHLQIRIFPLWQMTMTVLALLTLVAALQFIIEGMAGFGAIGLGRWPAVICGTLLWQPVMALLDRVREQCEMRSSNF